MGIVERVERDLVSKVKDVEGRIGKVLKILRGEEKTVVEHLKILEKELQDEANFLKKEFIEEVHIFRDFENLERAIRSGNVKIIHTLAIRLLKEARVIEKLERHAAKIENRKLLINQLENLRKTLEILLDEIPKLQNIIKEVHQVHLDTMKEVFGMFRELYKYRNIPEIAQLEEELRKLEKIEKRVSKVV